MYSIVQNICIYSYVQTNIDHKIERINNQNMKIEVSYIRCFIENLRRQHEELAHPFSTHRFK